MTPFLCEQLVDFDAHQGYEAKDIEKLVAEIQAFSRSQGLGKIVVLLRNAHYLTTKAFSVLYDYVRQSPSNNVVFIVSGDKSKIFPPFLEYLDHHAGYR